MNTAELVYDKKTNRVYPRALAHIGAGRHAHLRNLIVKCVYCETQYKLADSESPVHCQSCWDQAGEENEWMDRESSFYGE